MIFNLTQHQPTSEQEAAGVRSPAVGVKELLSFEFLPTKEDIWVRAIALAQQAKSAYNEYAEYADRGEGEYPSGQVLIGGAPYLMASLEAELRLRGLTPVYSFSERVSEEQVQADGSVRKVNVFRHVGFVGVQ